MSCNCGSSPCGCESLSIPIGPRGFQGEPGPAPTITVGTVTTLPAGSQATVNFTGQFGVYTADFGLVTGDTGATGAPGTNGLNGVSYTTLAPPGFLQPALDSIATGVKVGTTAFISVGDWLSIAGGGYYIVSAVLNDTQVNLINPGPTYNYPNGINLQTPPAVFVATDGTPNQVKQGGVAGLDGADGAPGATGTPGVSAFVGLTTTIPVSAPGPGLKTIFYTDNVVTPTIFRAYFYDDGTATWGAGPNIMGPAGTLIVTTGGDPNVTLPAGPIGTLAIRTDVPSLYVKTGVSTWAFVVSLTPTFQQVAVASAGAFGTVPVQTEAILGYTPFADTHTVPGSYLYDTQYASITLEADQDIELGIDSTNFTFSGQWLLQLTNTDASPINITYAASTWSKDTALTLPTTLAAGATQMFYFNLGTDSGLYCISQSFVEDPV